MKFIFDMVHHNPGEPEIETSFLSPEKLKSYNYNGQVFKHINCAVKFSGMPGAYVQDEEEKLWIEELRNKIRRQIEDAKRAGLKVFYHIDLFVLPKKLVNKYKSEIYDPETGRISIDKPTVLNIHQAMFDEIFEDFDIDGLIIRVGETYLFDTPYHTGNGAVNYDSMPSKKEKSQYIRLIDFLRQAICVKHDKCVIFRTWDCFKDRFHTNLQYYLDVTENIHPHEKLIFSIKHTSLDFWRNTEFNKVLGKGHHKQIVEVQCQREYEGKGAFPNYIMKGVIDGFEELAPKKGIKDIIGNDLVCGVYTWSRGGGWYGPYIKDEFWIDLNVFVIANWFFDTSKSEEEYFRQYCRAKLSLSKKDALKFRKICLLSSEAVLKGRYCKVFDLAHLGKRVPTDLWMRDDCLGGMDELEHIFKYLYKKDLFQEALSEKNSSVEIWKQIYSLFQQITFTDKSVKNSIETSIIYGLKLFELVRSGWEVLIFNYEGSRAKQDIKEAVERFDKALDEYKSVSTLPYSASLYRLKYWNWPDESLAEGLGDSINVIRRKLKSAT